MAFFSDREIWVLDQDYTKVTEQTLRSLWRAKIGLFSVSRWLGTEGPWNRGIRSAFIFHPGQFLCRFPGPPSHWPTTIPAISAKELTPMPPSSTSD